MNTTKTNTELVEVQMHFELPVYIPAVGADGELTYERQNLAPETGLKVKVPTYAIESEEALTSYLRQDYEDNCCDMVTFDNPNYWVEDKNHEDGGYFKWKLSFGRFDY